MSATDRSTRVILALGVLLTVHSRLFADPAARNDWPRFLGPAGNNISAETGLVEKWSTNGLPLVWQKEIGSGYSAPSVAGGKLVLHHWVNDDEVVQCFDAATGESL